MDSKTFMQLAMGFWLEQPDDKHYGPPALPDNWNEGNRYRGRWKYAWLAATVKALKAMTRRPVVVYEIGVYAGQSAAAFLYAGAIHYYGIDNFSLVPETKEIAVNVLASSSPGRPPVTDDNLSLPAAPTGNATLIIADSQILTPGALAEQNPIPADAMVLFSVDGAHDYQSESHDLRFALEFTRPGDMIIVDDYLDNNDSVTKACDEAAADERVRWHNYLPGRCGYFVMECG